MEAAALEAERKMDSRDVDSSSSSVDSDTEPLGSGPRGHGPPLEVGSHNRKRWLCDGGGLCSLGLWAPEHRPLITTPGLEQTRKFIDEGLTRLDGVIPGGYRAIFDALAGGEVQENPFPSWLTDTLAESLMSVWDPRDWKSRPQHGDRRMAIRGRLLQCLLREAGGPELRGLDNYFQGVRLGVNRRSPRTPAVFTRKRRWRLDGQSEADTHLGEEPRAVWRENHRSAAEHKALVRAYLEQHAADGGQGFPISLCLTEEEARHRFPNLTIMSLGAVTKVDHPEVVEDIRVVNDGTQRGRSQCPY